MAAQPRSLLSFVVPAHNEERELPAALSALRAAADAAGEPYEVIVVDDDSSDATARIAHEFGASVVPVRHRKIAAVRNAGGRAARGDILFFVDADTHIDARHITAALEAIRRGDAGGGARLELHGELPSWGPLVARVFCAVYFGANLGAGAFLFTTRANFEAVGGFDEQYFAGEEVYFTQALKRLGRFTILRHPARTSGRKLRMHSGGYLLRSVLQLVVGGKRAVLSREKLDLWYDGKRENNSI